MAWRSWQVPLFLEQVAARDPQAELVVIQDQAGFHLNPEQEGSQRGHLGVGDDAQATTPKAFGAEDLHGDRHESLAERSASPLPGLAPTDERLVDLNRPGELLTAGSHHDRAEAVQHGQTVC